VDDAAVVRVSEAVGELGGDAQDGRDGCPAFEGGVGWSSGSGVETEVGRTVGTRVEGAWERATVSAPGQAAPGRMPRRRQWRSRSCKVEAPK
jgi:hypothetical protein